MASKGDVQTLEKGSVYFFYRPKVNEEEPSGLGDVERMYMVLSPGRRDRVRLAVVGHKKLPDPSEKGRRKYWGFVDMVRKDPTAIRDELGSDEYRTKTRGRQHLPAARPVGEGVYRILRHGDHTHLAYALELPDKTGKVQKDLNIAREASYIISVKNPESGGKPQAGLSDGQQADFPKKLQEEFRGRKFADVDPPEFLDHEGCEFLLIPASDDVKEELGLELNPEHETRHSADVFQELRLDVDENPVRPLFEGKWD
ncbi:MAG: hypothetical protein R6W92_01670 [Desulfocurvibacter africanus]